MRIFTLNLILAGIMLLVGIAQGGELYEEEKLTGECNSHLRMPSATISNPYEGVPSILMTTERQYYGTACPTASVFERRGSVTYLDFIGKRFPAYDANMNQVGYVDGNTIFGALVGVWVLENRKSKKELGTLYSDPATICYTTSGNDPICRLP